LFAGNIYAPRKIKLIDVPDDAPGGRNVTDGDGQIVFQPELACLCGSDLLFFEGDYPEYQPEVGQSLHEMIGRVVQSDCSRFQQGQRVLCVPVDHFGFYERFRVSQSRAIPLNPRISDDEALLAQPLGTVLFGLKKLPSLLDKDVVVLGQGPIGQLFCAAASNLGAREIIAVDVLDDRLAVSPGMRATATINSAKQDLADAVRQITGGQLADVVIEAVGHREQRLGDCFDVVRPGGDILFFGVPTKRIDDVPWRVVFDKNASIHHSIGPSFERDFPLAMRWIAEGRLDVSPLITHHFPLDEIQQAFDTFAERRDGALKVFVDFAR
jgi:threonine dehydrogenase-like Zn-dependent dehydrogenase